MIKLLIFTILISLQIPHANATAPLCKNLFSKSQLDATTSLRKNSTQSFIAYFQESLDNQIITEKELQFFTESFKSNQLINPIPHELTPHGPIFMKAAYQIHYEAFDRFINEESLDLKTISKWVAKVTKKEQETKSKRNHTKQNTLDISQKIEFHHIEPGEFIMSRNVMGKISDPVEVKITKPFELMTTPVTQLMWAKLIIAMGEKNIEKITPSTFKTGTDSKKMKIDKLEIEIKPDNPVENIDWNEVDQFIVELNKLSKSNDDKIQVLLKELIPNHKKGDNYRLPTEAEWSYVANKNDLYENYRKSGYISEIADYAWFNKNSDNQTHPVGQKLPVIIDGKEFFDLFGNVDEWVQDWHSDKLIGGNDPQGAEAGFHKSHRGGSYRHEIFSMSANSRGYWSPSNKGGDVGFRLVRDVQ